MKAHDNKDLKSTMPADIFDAHSHSLNNRKEITKSNICGCFYCMVTFSPEKISEWVTTGNNDEFAACPYCGFDTVIGDKSGYPITDEFIREMNKYWMKDS